MDKEIRRARRIPREDTVRDHIIVGPQASPETSKYRGDSTGCILSFSLPRQRCSKAISEVPMVAYRKPKSLRDILGRAENI